MAPLAVDPDALDGAGSAVISVGEGLGSVISTLTTALTGCNGMAGDDPAGAAFGNSYNSAASKMLEAMSTTRNGLCRLGDGVRMSAHNYSTAEAMSNISEHGQPLPGPHPTGSISTQSVPSAVGSGVGAPAGWGWVSKYIGMIWPSGDSAKLRDRCGRVDKRRYGFRGQRGNGRSRAHDDRRSTADPRRIGDRNGLRRCQS